MEEGTERLAKSMLMDAERRRLRRIGLPNLAESVRWISRESLVKDMTFSHSKKMDRERFIEVKSSIGSQRTFEMSDNEWRTACRLGEAVFHI